MRTIIPVLILLALVSTFSKVPFKTLYIEIKKERYEGDPALLTRHKDNTDKLDVYISYQKIWVNVTDNSYLMIEEPAEGNDIIEKNGKLKYEDRHYTLDYGLNFAWDGTDAGEKIFDNYTTDEPNYEYWGGKLRKRLYVTIADGVKRKAHRYTYSYFDATDEYETDAYVNEIKNSDMPEEDKNIEIQAALGALEKKAIKYTEWIWVDNNKVETKMFLRKYETSMDVRTVYEVTKLIVNEPLEEGIFEEALSKFKIKKVKG